MLRNALEVVVVNRFLKCCKCGLSFDVGESSASAKTKTTNTKASDNNTQYTARHA
jgi:hypothetical protein